MSTPTAEQQHAANPAHSVWVSASAGTGKTRVLVNRLLRLMLAGSAPEKLLCITFTKAAAAEVLQRVQQEVLKWSILPVTDLKRQLFELLEREPAVAEIKRARKLLPVILQSPGGMKILTIHAFCQSVLARFPLEAQISPGFTIADEAQTRILLDQAKFQLLDEATETSHPELFNSLTRFFDRVDENSQNNLIQSVLLKRYRLNDFFTLNQNNFTACKQTVCKLIGINEVNLIEDQEKIFLESTCHDTLKHLVPELIQGSGKTPLKRAEEISDWLANTLDIKNYFSLFLTQDQKIRSNITSGLDKAPSWVTEFLRDEAQRVLNHIERVNKIDLAKDTISLLHISQEILLRYQELKQAQSILDYEDQIILTAQLLKNPLDSQWVHYKLDGGIDHILVDEAQDTSPVQWDIIKGLTFDFFTGHGTRETGARSLFVVGDEKQSIFSFQNADPVEFSRAREFFAQKSIENKSPWQDISLIDNFRSAPLILKLTDQVFSDSSLAAMISHQGQAIQHHAFHASHAAEIELWPLIPKPDKENTAYNSRSEIILANRIADKVQLLLQENPGLQPGDIMILVSKRTPMVSPLNKAFKDRNIAVASADRLVLREQLAVQDCLMAMQACLHLMDDYALACFLKSPFISLSEDALYKLAIKRGDRALWDCLLASDHNAVISYIEKLSGIVSAMQPGPFIHALLCQPCPADSRSGRHGMVRRLGHDCEDVLDELLLMAYDFDANNDGSAQSFVTWMQNNPAVIKRANSEADNSRMQIMTVHAAKGLQAPIVFLADTMSKPSPYKSVRDVLWMEQNKNGFLWGVGNTKKTPVFEMEKQRYTKLQFSEYYRLLYVALTRAQSHLIICGCEGKQTQKEFPSWYESVQNAIVSLSQLPEYTSEEIDISGKIGIHLLQNGIRLHTKPGLFPVSASKTLPDHLAELPKQEAKRLRPLRPSRSPETEMPVLSPLQPQHNNSYKRGQILHSLFRLIPDYPLEQQETFLKNLLDYHVSDQKIHAEMYREVLNVLHHETFGHLFTANAKAEVPVVGEVLIDGEHYAVRGQIDRLLVEKDRVLIVDYKTNRPPVLDAKKIPTAYRYQLRAYAALMEKIYPDKKIETAILWTSIPYLLPVSG